MKVLFRGDFSSVEEYGYMTRAYCEGLLSVGVDLLYEEFIHDTPRISLGRFWKEQLEKNKDRTDRAQVKIWNETPNTMSPSPAMKNVALVSWDASHLPCYGEDRNNWVTQMNKMDLVWVPSTATKEAAVRSKVTSPIEVIPYPINTTTFNPTGSGTKSGQCELYDSARLPLHDGWFKFLSVFPYSDKYDLTTLLLAYLSEFRLEEQTALILRTYDYKSGGLDSIKKMITKFRQELRLQTPKPRIFLVPGTLNEKEVADLIRCCNCSVAIAKGESTARSQLESMACGVPVIAPNGSGFKDYINTTNGYPVEVHEEPVNGVGSIPWYYCTQTWHRIDVLDLRAKMRQAYAEADTMGDKSAAAIETVRSVSTETVGRQMQKSLENLLGS